MSGHSELRKARAVLSGGITELGAQPERWYRVDADYGAGPVFVGEANDRTGYLILTDRAWQDGAKNVAIYLCERLF